MITTESSPEFPERLNVIIRVHDDVNAHFVVPLFYRFIGAPVVRKQVNQLLFEIIIVCLGGEYIAYKIFTFVVFDRVDQVIKKISLHELK